MTICTYCRLALHQAVRQRPRYSQCATLSTKAASPTDMLSKPTWSIRSLVSPSSSDPAEAISPTQLHHLLRLSALPLPKSKAEEDSMIATLQSQLQFVRTVQRVNTEGVEPLRAIRDETDAAVKENTVALDDVKDILAKETLVGHYQRPRRVRGKVESTAENWDALSAASRRAGRFFVVESGSKAGGEP